VLSRRPCRRHPRQSRGTTGPRTVSRVVRSTVRGAALCKRGCVKSTPSRLQIDAPASACGRRLRAPAAEGLARRRRL